MDSDVMITFLLVLLVCILLLVLFLINSSRITECEKRINLLIDQGNAHIKWLRFLSNLHFPDFPVEPPEGDDNDDS